MNAVRVIANPAAAGGRTLTALPAVRAQLAGLGLDPRIELTRGLEHARELGRAAAAEGEIAAAFGGDGLIAAVAGALMGSDGVLGVLPGGRGNDFARTLGIPRSPVAACEVLAQGHVRRIDLGRAGGRAFIGIASCGFDSDANRIANQTRLINGTLVYSYAALRALSGWSRATFEVQVDGGECHTFTGYSVAAANAKAFGGGMLLAPNASLNDGLLDIVTVSQVPKLRYLSLLPSVFSGRHLRASFVHLRRARTLHISADRPFTLYADGDPIAELPVRIEAMPDAVRVLAPAPRAAEARMRRRASS